MKRVVKLFLAYLIRHKSIRDFLFIRLKDKYQDENESSIYISRFRQFIIQEIFKYPSIINNGYLHIERSIHLIKTRNLEGLKIIDIGAAAGETCLRFSQSLPEAEIIGFEPIRKTFKRLEDNTKNFANIKVFNIALGKEKGVSSINIMDRITSSSIYPSQANSNFDGNQYFNILETEPINIESLDHFGYRDKSIALIKIDVQGFELEVLKGALNTLLNTHFILVELQNHEIYIGAPRYYEIDAFLREVGFELFDIIPSIRQMDQIKEFDSIYINRRIHNS
jgi:FkbM family methyltransferase